MDGLPFVAAAESTAAGEPGHGALNGPAVAPEAFPVFHAFAGDAGCDVPVAEPLPQVAAVVSLVGVKFGGPTPTGPAARADGRYAPHGRLKSPTVVAIRTGDADRKRKPGPFGDHMDLRPVLAPIRRIRTRQIPFLRARMCTESTAHRDQFNSPCAPSSSSTNR